MGTGNSRCRPNCDSTGSSCTSSGTTTDSDSTSTCTTSTCATSTAATSTGETSTDGASTCTASSSELGFSSESQTTIVHAACNYNTEMPTKFKKFQVSENYNEFLDGFGNRGTQHPTSDLETLMHLVKGAMGSGIMAIPYAFKHAGLWFGLFASLGVGFLCAYCIHMVVHCAHILIRRHGFSKLLYGEIAEYAVREGPARFRHLGKKFKFMVNLFIAGDLLSCCCIYLVFGAGNVKQIMDHYFQWNWDVRVWIAIFMIAMICMSLVKNLKSLVPFSVVANAMLLIGLIITASYVFTDLPKISSVPAVAPISDWPMFFGVVIFAVECVGVAMELENDMKYPEHFTGCPSVLCVGMSIVIVLYSAVGFFGYLKYGNAIQGSLTLNLPVEEGLAQSVKLMIGLAIFFTFTIQFYVPLNIIWDSIKSHVSRRYQTTGNYLLRVGLVLLCGIVAILLPDLGPLISLVGALCLSVIGLIAPAIIELLVYYEEPGYGSMCWRFYKNVFLILFGIVGLFAGCYKSINEFITKTPVPLIEEPIQDENRWLLFDYDDFAKDFWKRSNKPLWPYVT